jgi:Ca2+-binding RTX toxin-like protein
MTNLTGDANPNVFFGTEGDDVLTGLGGDDILHGYGGADQIYGGDGTDELYGGLGGDMLDGGAGADLLTAYMGMADQLFGGAGNDRLNVGSDSGADSGDATAMVDGGDGNDIIDISNRLPGQLLTATVFGGAGDDKISLTGHLIATVDAGAGNDEIDQYEPTNNTLTLGAGVDTLVMIEVAPIALTTITDFATGAGGDVISFYLGGLESTLIGWDGSNPFGMSGYLRLAQQGADTVMLIDLDGYYGGQYLWTDLVVFKNTQVGSFTAENFQGWPPNGAPPSGQTITGTSGNDILYGGVGPDTVYGGDGNDILDGSIGNDALYGGAGDDTLKGDKGSDILGGGAGADTLFGGEGGDSLSGGDGDDTLYGGESTNNLHGQAGDDILYGNGTGDYLYGGAGNNVLHGGGADYAYYNEGFSNGGVTVDLAAGTAVGSDSSDTLIGIENVFGSFSNDLIKGDGVHNSLFGQDGDDILYGLGGDDSLVGGAGADTLYGGAGRDVAVYTGTFAASAPNLTHNADGSWTVTTAQFGSDTLVGVEQLYFYDRNVILTQPTRSDFNADGKSDVLWRNDNGELYVWNSQGGQGAFLGQSLGNPGTGWHVQDVADYSGDGKADVLWRNNAGDLYLYRSDAGAAVSFSGQSISHVDPVWAVVPASGDVDGDGCADILFRNTGTGEVYLWNSQSSPYAVNFLGQSLGTVGANWHIQGVDDFNADGKADVLWRNDAGDVYVWTTQGGENNSNVTMAGQSISSVGNDWTILGTGDFNGDGRADILWRHTDGELYVWNSQTGSAAVNFLGQSVGVVGLDWTVAAIGDYDGDGRADVLFRNADGRVYLWNSNDTGPVGFVGQGLGTTPTDWHILSDFHGM